MFASQYVVTACLIALGAAHSMLGERSILQPLFAQPWDIGMPRWAVDRILRFAWHLTSMAWVALAAIAAGVSPFPAIAALCLLSAALIFVMLRGHLAWPLFLLAGLAALRFDGRLGEDVLAIGTWLTVAVLVLAAAVHVYWAAGGQWQIDSAMPPADEHRFNPGPLLILAVAVALVVFAGLVALSRFAADAPPMVRWLTMAGVAVLAVRAIGDTKFAGFTKTDRHTKFAKADDKYFTPLIVLLALGAAGALV